MTAKERRLQELEIDVDVRMAELSALVMTCDRGAFGALLDEDDARAALFGFLRTAYAAGYSDALREVSEGRGGELNRRHGYALPA